MAKNDLLIAWLNDAHALQSSKLEMLERFAADFANFPDIQERLKEFCDEAEQQQEDVKTCIESLEGKVSGTKSFLGTIMGAAQGMGTSMYTDEPVKDILMVHAGEHFAHACFMSLAAGANELGEETVADVCERIAEQELKAADWAEEQIPVVTQAVITSQSR